MEFSAAKQADGKSKLSYRLHCRVLSRRDEKKANLLSLPFRFFLPKGEKGKRERRRHLKHFFESGRSIHSSISLFLYNVRMLIWKNSQLLSWTIEEAKLLFCASEKGGKFTRGKEKRCWAWKKKQGISYPIIYRWYC